MTQEQWRPIEGYERLYEVSNLGRVKRLDGYDSRGRKWKGKILSPRMTKLGYLQVHLYKEGKGKMFSVHRLVAQSFIPNPEGLPIINHKDENPKNNRVDNLEWCTTLYNNTYGTRTERVVQTRISNGNADPDMCGIIKNEGEKEYQRLYYQKNREKKLEYDRLRYQKNREKILEHKREYRRRKKQVE